MPERQLTFTSAANCSEPLSERSSAVTSGHRESVECSSPASWFDSEAIEMSVDQRTLGAACQSVGRDGDAISTKELPSFIDDYLAMCEIAQHSKATLEVRRIMLGRLHWFLQKRQMPSCGRRELMQFFAYLSRAHESPEGRWDNPHHRVEMRPCTISTYHRHIKSFFRWLVKEEYIELSPMERIPRPVVREDQVEPFTPDHIAALFQQADKSRNRRRDTAILCLLFDCGLRASELCSLRVYDIDLKELSCRVLGKGNKHRRIFFSKDTRRALYEHLRREVLEQDDPLFFSQRGQTAREPLTRNGLFQLVQRLGRAAGIQRRRCSPHTFRHSFAVETLRAGGNVFALKEALGHRSLSVSNRYLALSQIDLKEQARRCSPVDRMRLRRE